MRPASEFPAGMSPRLFALILLLPAALAAGSLREAVDLFKAGRVPEYWDGRAAMRIAHALKGWLPQQKGTHVLSGARPA